MDTQNRRLYLARKDMGMTQKRAAEMVALSLRAYVRYELDDTNKREIPAKVLTAYAQKGININWLLTGEGQMYLSAGNPAEDYEQEPTRMSNGLYVTGDKVFVPLSGMQACCGAGFVVYPQDYEIEETIAVNKSDLGRLVEGQLPYAVETYGRSMEGYGIPQGSTVIVNPAEAIQSGDVIMIIIDEKAAIKKIFIKPDGEDYIASTGEQLHASSSELEDDCYIRKCGKIMLVIAPPCHGV